MAAPFPSEAAPGGTQYRQRSELIYRMYVDAARLSDQIVNIDAAIDLQKVAQLAFVIAPTLSAETQSASDAFKSAAMSKFAVGGIEWETQNAMVADIVAIRNELNAFKTWVEANLSAALEPATVTYSTNSTTFTLVPATLAKPHAVVAEVQKIRSLYA